jgi:hypothetical protein
VPFLRYSCSKTWKPLSPERSLVGRGVDRCEDKWEDWRDGERGERERARGEELCFEVQRRKTATTASAMKLGDDEGRRQREGQW